MFDPKKIKNPAKTVCDPDWSTHTEDTGLVGDKGTTKFSKIEEVFPNNLGSILLGLNDNCS